ncbi:hypothetical protein BZA70DRAFT_30169 [Myxozyma melibiosi]|uniref:Uncharacterized protein n=1 Tax=Myxozyma melibiosi TaxID=54550 RepID=A0ABR1FDS3_9ASCO
MAFFNRFFSFASGSAPVPAVSISAGASPSAENDSFNDFVIINLQDAETIEAAAGHVVVDSSASLSEQTKDSGDADEHTASSVASQGFDDEYVGLQVRRLTYAEAFRQGLPPSGYKTYRMLCAERDFRGSKRSMAPSHVASAGSSSTTIDRSSRKVELKMLDLGAGAWQTNSMVGVDELDQERLLFADRKAFTERRREKSHSLDKRARLRATGAI